MDITNIDTVETTGYLSLVTNAHSRRIMGYHLHPSLHTDGVVKALLMGLRQRTTDRKLIHQSDGDPVLCATYQRIHDHYGVTYSMTDGYDCYQTALAERINGILKTELLTTKAKDLKQAGKMIRQATSIYNTERPHMSLEYKTPDAVHGPSIGKCLRATKGQYL